MDKELEKDTGLAISTQDTPPGNSQQAGETPPPKDGGQAPPAPSGKRGPGRPKGSKTKNGVKKKPAAPSSDPADPFASVPKPPPARRPEAQGASAAEGEVLPPESAEEPAEEPKRLGEEGAKELLPLVYMILDAGGIGLGALVFAKAPEAFRELVKQTMPLSEEERARLEPGLVRRLAELEMTEDESFGWMLLGLFGIKLIALQGLRMQMEKQAREQAQQSGPNP